MRTGLAGRGEPAPGPTVVADAGRADDPVGAPEPARRPVVALAGVHRTFNAEMAPVRALRGASLTVWPGEFVAVTGPSGSGKSTLLNIIAGLERADDGSVVVADEALDELSEAGLARLRRQHVGMVFQFFHLLESMTAADNVVLAARLSGLGRRAAVRRAQDLLDVLGLLERAEAMPATLSGGQRQRLAIARALAGGPTLLLADEPTGALDSAGAAEVLDLFTRLHARGQTIIMITHDPKVAAGARRVVTMRDGLIEDAANPGAEPVDAARGTAR
ncbi:ABC transporter ATP-binding protein [Frankia sp. CNm7]|uniref:ABC transporter ATP-binding protein n=1 Tax=Frankia nepalensis TaxID=1836974 RepID=A0A937RPW4_9ACTN|nr:ABC transporter ATP-binding protein [Frankia nepalensis]MBL7515691.1 ABC transporter ATP-binding protein [Frankia nepalensis]MBL7520141.1 ABC transporter ATP-binding protein [Frankia nepalensis]MBL7632749.1 ABC transporter ATP-binding protein [Frankia nepalensis]